MNRFLVAALALSFLTFDANAAPARLAKARPNIVLIMTDDQGYGELSCHGNTLLPTPQLDRLHREGARFLDFQVSPTCAPTRSALLTGRHEFRNGVTHTIFERERMRLDAVTLPEVLRRAGYATGIFGKWHLGDEDEYQPGRRGFDEVFVHGGGGIGQTFPGSCGDAPENRYRNPAIRHNGRFVRTEGYCTDVFFQQARQWIEERTPTRRPFFAYITPNAPHDPFVSPGPHYDAMFQGKGLGTNSVQYYSMIKNIDDNVGRLLDTLGQLGIERETLVIFMTDNGHSVGSLFNAGMRAMKGTVYQGGIRVPSLWRWPGRILPGDRTQLAAHLDVFPTLAEIAGISLDPAVRRQVEGRSLVPALQDAGAEWPDRLLVSHLGRWPSGSAEQAKHRQSAIRNHRFKLVNNEELYDLAADPAESRNVISEHPLVAARLRLAYEHWWAEVLPSALASDMATGPKVNPFKEAYWVQFGGGPTPALLNQMDPAKKFIQR